MITIVKKMIDIFHTFPLKPIVILLCDEYIIFDRLELVEQPKEIFNIVLISVLSASAYYNKYCSM